jgi:hypothetical protein
MEALPRVKLDGFEVVISELEVELDYLRRRSRNLVRVNKSRQGPADLTTVYLCDSQLGALDSRKKEP